MIDEFKLAELLNSRYCHDLAGPIGAISNGVEFLVEGNESMREKATNLVEESSYQAISRLQLFRHIYGSVPATGEANLTYFRELFNNYFKNSKITLDWNINQFRSTQTELSHREAKVLLNLIMIGSSVLTKGGNIKISSETQNRLLIVRISASAEEVKLDEEFNNILEGRIDFGNLSSRNIQVYYSHRLINAIRAMLEINLKKNMLLLELKLTRDTNSDVVGENNG